MNRAVRSFALVVACAAASPAIAEDFTGDTKLACEAIMCLSTGNRPDECTPSIKKYFSISARKISDTIKKRKGFLELCPDSTTDDTMKSLVDTIANGAGRCDAATLNSSNSVFIGHGNSSYVRNSLPSYCAAYGSNANVDQTTGTIARYVGEPGKGGHWVDADEYEAALAAYNKRGGNSSAGTNNDSGWNSDSTGWNQQQR
ncbi:TrbM/KikA/MpfK family conjugal transfer protein [Xanthomonas axonopodis]|uniref:TrbM/KikA/MpfK family conjugal transfer protein n=1 Tax=Xanthomonas axonopodis TaxID=53413 RepID=UPI003558B4FD